MKSLPCSPTVFKSGDLVKCHTDRIDIFPIGTLWTDGILSIVFIANSQNSHGYKFDVIFICFDTGGFQIANIHKEQLNPVI